MRVLFAVTALLSLCALAAAAGIWGWTQKRMDGLESRWSAESIEQAPPSRAPEPMPALERVSLLEARISTLEERLGALDKRGADTTRSGLVSGPQGPSPADGSLPAFGKLGENPAGPAGTPNAKPTREVLESKVRELEEQISAVEEKLKEGNPDPKPSFERLAARLELDERQMVAVKDSLVRGQQELLEQIRRPRGDGSVLADDLAEAFYQSTKNPEEGQRSMLKVFGRLMVEKVPGTEKTYLETMEETNRRVSTEMKSVMTPEQEKTFSEWAPKPIDIELDGGPLQQYILEYIKKKDGDTPTEGR